MNDQTQEAYGCALIVGAFAVGLLTCLVLGLAQLAVGCIIFFALYLLMAISINEWMKATGIRGTPKGKLFAVIAIVGMLVVCSFVAFVSVRIIFGSAPDDAQYWIGDPPVDSFFHASNCPDLPKDVKGYASKEPLLSTGYLPCPKCLALEVLSDTTWNGALPVHGQTTFEFAPNQRVRLTFFRNKTDMSCSWSLDGNLLTIVGTNLTGEQFTLSGEIVDGNPVVQGVTLRQVYSPR